MDNMGLIYRDGMCLEPVSCEVCQVCWREVGKGPCLYGGPYLGYVIIEEEGRGSGPDFGKKPPSPPELGDDGGSDRGPPSL